MHSAGPRGSERSPSDDWKTSTRFAYVGAYVPVAFPRDRYASGRSDATYRRDDKKTTTRRGEPTIRSRKIVSAGRIGREEGTRDSFSPFSTRARNDCQSSESQSVYFPRRKSFRGTLYPSRETFSFSTAGKRKRCATIRNFKFHYFQRLALLRCSSSFIAFVGDDA